MKSTMRVHNKVTLGLLVSFLVMRPHLSKAAVWDFDFDFSGYNKQAELLITDCSTDVRSQVNAVLCGDPEIDCFEEPTVNEDLPHVTCDEDRRMGRVLKMTIYKTDNDPTNKTDRQRLEMKVWEPSPEELKAGNNSNYIYSWWFQLDPYLTPGDSVKPTFFHTFQLKPIGVNMVDTYPMFTFTITELEGFHFRLRNYQTTFITYPMLTTSEALGRWIQVFVEAQFKRGESDDPNDDSGYVRVILKDQSGIQLYPLGNETGYGYSNMFWDDIDFVRPKWGLYRNLSDLHQPSDWQIFQNVQIWKKD